MKHLWKGASALVLFGASVFAATPGCVEAEAPFFIVSAKAPTCEAVTPDSNNLFQGVMDVRYSCEYYGVLELGNQLVRRGDETKLQVETSRISVNRFDVDILTAGEEPVLRADGQPARFSYPTNGFVDPATASSPGQGLAATLLIDAGTAQVLGEALVDDNPDNNVKLLIARVVGYGRTLGGDDVKTRPWDFPITVCYGCLCFCNPDLESFEQCAPKQDFDFSCEFLTGGTCEVDSPCLSND
jgi:hypothetical protein